MLLYVTICYGNCSSVSWLSHGKGIKSVKASQSYQAPVDLCRPFQFPPRNLQSWLMELPLAKKKKAGKHENPVLMFGDWVPSDIVFSIARPQQDHDFTRMPMFCFHSCVLRHASTGP